MNFSIKHYYKLFKYYLKQIFIKENQKKIMIDFINFFKLFINNLKSISIKDFDYKHLPLTLYKMLFKSFFSWFLVAQTLFIIILLIIDLFLKLNDYINYSVNIINILSVTFLFVPKAISQTLPVAIMFGITMTLGTFYQNNELVAIYTSGISIFKLTFPIIIFNFLLSFGMIFGNANAVIPIERYRLDYYEQVTKKMPQGNLIIEILRSEEKIIIFGM